MVLRSVVYGRLLGVYGTGNVDGWTVDGRYVGISLAGRSCELRLSVSVGLGVRRRVILGGRGALVCSGSVS
jgi:hypothetical protein